MPRIAGLRGRLPVRPEGEKFAIGYVHAYLGQPLPAPQYPVDVSGSIRAWGMAGNDQYGDCTFAGRLHYQMAKAVAGHEPAPTETADQLVAEYFAYTHGQDVGANIADLLLAWYRDAKILAFAPVNHTDPAAVDAAMAAFHGVYAGVNLTDDADQLFEQGHAWTTANGERPDPQAGHCIVKVKSEGATGPDTWVTWGALQDSTAVWTSECLEEAWVLITQEDADAASLDIAALRADIDALHGTGGDSPAPHAISHPGRLLHELAGLIREVATAPGRGITDVVAWLRAHGL